MLALSVIVLAGVVVLLLVAIVVAMVAVATSGRVERAEAIAVMAVVGVLLLCCGTIAAGLVYGLFGFNVMRPAPAPAMPPPGARVTSTVRVSDPPARVGLVPPDATVVSGESIPIGVTISAEVDLFGSVIVVTGFPWRLSGGPGRRSTGSRVRL